MDHSGAQTWHTFTDPYGGVITNTLPLTLTEQLAGNLDAAAGLQFDGLRFYDPLVGSFVQPSPFGAVPGAPQSLNRFGAASGALPMADGKGGLPPLVVDIGKSTVSNSASAGISARWLESVPGRLVSQVASWQWLSLHQASFVRNSAQVPLLVRLMENRVHLGPFALQRIKDGPGGRSYSTLVSNLPDDFEALLRSGSRRGIWGNAHPIGLVPGRVWNSSFGLSRVSPGLARHFTVGSLSAGVVADVVVGGIWQGVEDYDLWATDPWLASRRVGAAAGTNATNGVIGTIATGIVLAPFVAAGATPPGWVVVGLAVGFTVAVDVSPIGGTVNDWWFETLKANID